MTVDIAALTGQYLNERTAAPSPLPTTALLDVELTPGNSTGDTGYERKATAGQLAQANGGGLEMVNAIGDFGGGTQDIDLDLGNVVTATVSTATATFTFSNPPASGTAGAFTLVLTNGGSQTVNWPASVAWAGGSAPGLTSSGVDVLTFLTVDGGTTWYGFAAGLDMQ